MSTPPNYAQGVLDGLAKLGVEGAEIAHFAHGTTAATNAILTKSGARTGLLTTKGFRDVLEMRRGDREICSTTGGGHRIRSLPETINSRSTSGSRSTAV